MELLTEEEYEKLAYIGAELCLDRFEYYLEKTGDFAEALGKAFPEVEEEKDGE